MNTDDLLSFKEYSPTKDSYTSGGRAEININSPNRTINPYSDQHLEGLIDDMSTSVRVLDREDEMIQNGNCFPFHSAGWWDNRFTSTNCEFFSDGDGSAATDKQIYSFFSIEYYQQFFNVDTSMVIERIVSSIVPRKAPPSYLKQHIGLNPDLYGPFWIVVTLVSECGICLFYWCHEMERAYGHMKRWKSTTISTNSFVTQLTLLVPPDLLDCNQW